VLDDHIGRRESLHGPDRREHGLDWGFRLAGQRPRSGDHRSVASHPARVEKDRVLELRVRVKRGIDAIPQACGRRDSLAAADFHCQRSGDLVGGTTEDDERAWQLLPEVGEGERRRDHPGWNGVVPAGVNRLDRSVRPKDRHGVVEGDETDRPARPRAAQRGTKGRRHPSQSALHLEPAVLEDGAEVPRALVLGMGQLRMLMHEAMRRQRRLALRLDRRQDPLVVQASSSIAETGSARGRRTRAAGRRPGQAQEPPKRRMPGLAKPRAWPRCTGQTAW
jgi:hypothetical protein